MMNNPKSEPYYSYLIRLGYVFCNYSKDCAPSYLVQVLCLMQETTNIKGKSFGMMERNGQARFLSWKDFYTALWIECLKENVPKIVAR